MFSLQYHKQLWFQSIEIVIDFDIAMNTFRFAALELIVSHRYFEEYTGWNWGNCSINNYHHRIDYALCVGTSFATVVLNET